jgi:hypothetical protein
MQQGDFNKQSPAGKTKDGNTIVKITHPVDVYQAVAVQNSEDSKTMGAPRCEICEALAKDENQRKLFEAKVRALLQSIPAAKGDEAFDHAYSCFVRMLEAGKIHNLNYLTVADYNQPDTAKRLYKISLNGDSPAVKQYQVAQSVGSADFADHYATKYSDAQCSKAISPGCYLTGEHWPKSEWGNSIIFDGQDPENKQARCRCILAHTYNPSKDKMPYDPTRPPPTWGCFGLGRNKKTADEVINSTANGSVWYVQKLASSSVDTKTRSVCEKKSDENKCCPKESPKKESAKVK